MTNPKPSDMTLYEILDEFTTPGKGDRHLRELETAIQNLAESGIPEKGKHDPVDGTEQRCHIDGYNAALKELRQRYIKIGLLSDKEDV